MHLTSCFTWTKQCVQRSHLFLGSSVLLLGSQQLSLQPLSFRRGHLSVVISLFVSVSLQPLQHSVRQWNIPRVEHVTDVFKRRLLGGSEAVFSIQPRISAVLQQHLYCIAPLSTITVTYHAGRVYGKRNCFGLASVSLSHLSLVPAAEHHHTLAATVAQ